MNDIEITDPTSIANAFNNYFANIGSDLASAIPSVINSAYEWMSPLPRDSFFLSPITPFFKFFLFICHRKKKLKYKYEQSKKRRWKEKLSNYLNSKTLLDLYYALVYPFLTYCIIAWGNTYQTSLQPLFVLQKKAIRIITFSRFFEHTSPLFNDLNVIKLFDEVTVHIAVFIV